MSIEMQFICYLMAFILFVGAAAGLPSRVNFIAAGLAAWVLVPLVTAGKAI